MSFPRPFQILPKPMSIKKVFFSSLMVYISVKSANNVTANATLQILFPQENRNIKLNSSAIVIAHQVAPSACLAAHSSLGTESPWHLSCQCSNYKTVQIFFLFHTFSNFHSCLVILQAIFRHLQLFPAISRIFFTAL